MLLNDVTLHEENFFPSMTETADQNVYVIDGSRTSIVRVDGLTTLRRLPETSLEITPDQIRKATSFIKEREASRQSALGAQTLPVLIQPGPAPALPDLANSLKTARWATVDQRITQQGWEPEAGHCGGCNHHSGRQAFRRLSHQ